MTTSPNKIDPILRVENLNHTFHTGSTQVRALKRISFEAHSGEVTAVVGPSGCGKSTLLYLLGLLDQPESGEVFFNGNPVAHSNEATRTRLRNQKIGFVFQFHFLIKELTARENVALPLRKSGTGRKEALAKADVILARLGLEDKVDRFVNKLSGGEQQRVAIARALVNSPALLLADEPTGNLDTQNSQKVFELLKEFALAENIAVLLVTHNLEIAQNCHRCLRMRDGELS